jgi:hypothetical protein
MAILDAVFADKQGQTPQDIERRRRMALELLAKSQENERITSPWQGAAKVAQALVGGYEEARANSDDKANRANANALLTKTLLGDAAPSGQAPIPSPGAANEISNTAPGNPSYRDAIASIESDGSGGYSAVGPTHPKMGRALGRYQIMESNIGPWSQEALGRAVTPDEFLADPKLQDAIFDKKFGGYVSQYGPEGAAQAWFAGPGGVGKLDRKDSLGTSVGDYTQKFSNALGTGPQVASLDPSVGMPARAPMQGPTLAAPALPPPTTIASAPQVASVPQQQSIMGSPVPGQQQAPQMLAQAQPNRRAQIAALLQNPYTQEMGQQMLMEEYQRQQDADNLILKQKLQQSDPKYQTELQKSQIELQNLREPKMTPAEQATNAREQEKMKFEREKFDREVEKGQWQKLTDGRLYNQTTGEFRDAPPPVPGSVPPKFDDISNLRKEIHQLPSYKNVAQALPIYRSMAETAGRNSKASDLNLVYGLGKIMDPTSVVREGEMVMVKNTASLPDWLQGAIASLNGGAALTPETRQAIMTEAYGRIQGYDSAFKQDVGQYQGIVERNKFNPADVIPDFGGYEPWKAAPDTPQEPAAPPAPGEMNKTSNGTPWKVIK